jgi:hypothetical protein
MLRRFLPLLLLASGCVVNPLPEPPGEPQLGDDVTGFECTSCDGQRDVTGTTTDADSIWAVSLDTQEPAQLVPVADDGSFKVTLFVSDGQQVRLQARDGSSRGAPIDFVVGDGKLAQVAHSIGECFHVEPELGLGKTQVGDSSMKKLHLTHDCSSSLTIGSIALRAPIDGITVQSIATPVTLDAGDTLDVDVDFAPTVGGLHEEVVLIELTAPMTDRRAVTVYGTTD